MFKFDTTYLNLPSHFYSHEHAAHFKKTNLIAFNFDLAKSVLGADFSAYNHDQLAQYFSGQVEDKESAFLSAVYAGHQFGHFNPQLGDGRALLLGEVVAPNGQRFDIQLKGSGPTVFSRNGDGKSALGPVIREYIVSEAMHYLNVPTTRALCAVSTGEMVQRETPLPGGVFTRVAKSHIRIGTFEFFAARNDISSVKALADYTINRHFPEAKSAKNPYLSLIGIVAKNWADLVAKWMSYGFIHGVMNTDNMAISGETIDYGPCAFMDHFSFNKVFSYIDRHGRYAYSNQVQIAKWNLTRFASAMLALVDENQVRSTLDELFLIYDQSYMKEMCKKIGIEDANEDDLNLVHEFLSILEKNELDYTNSFVAIGDDPSIFDNLHGFSQWTNKWRSRVQFEQAQKVMKKTNPLVIPRNHQIEQAIQKAYQGDYSHFLRLNKAYKNPFCLDENDNELTSPPKPHERIQNTFCGT